MSKQPLFAPPDRHLAMPIRAAEPSPRRAHAPQANGASVAGDPADATPPGSAPPGAGSARPRLSRERVLSAALKLADEQGLGALSMRRLGQALGVEAMSLYRHVANKDAILDALVEAVLEEVALPTRDEAWRVALARRARSGLEAFRQHPWAVALLETRGAASPAALRCREATLDCLQRQGFSPQLAAHSAAALDSYLCGFALQHPKQPSHEGAAEGRALVPAAGSVGEFEWGLELLLEGFQRRLDSESRS